MSFENSEILNSRYFYETLSLSGIQTSQLQITSVCNAKCFFCSNNQNPFKIHREGFRKLSEIKSILKLMRPGHFPIHLNDSLPGRISEGEALLHPQLFEILKEIRKKFPKNKLHITTNGSRLTKEMILKLKKYNPIEIQISYHTHNKEKWCKIFKLSPNEYEIAKNSFKILKENNFVLHATMTPLVNLLGYKDIENTIKFVKNYTSKINFYIPGYTKLSREWIKKVMNINLIQFSKFITYINKKYNLNYSFELDPLKPLKINPLEIMKETQKNNFKNVLWLASESAYKRLKQLVTNHSQNVINNHKVILTKNLTYEGNITCSGLLMVNDFKIALENEIKINNNYDLILLPKNKSCDLFEDDITGKNYNELYDKYPNLTFWSR